MGHEPPQEEHNALLHLFSTRVDLLRCGATHYRSRSPKSSTLLLQLFDRYRLEATLTPDVLEQFAAETIEQLLKKLPAERLVEGQSPDELLAALSPEPRAALARRLKEDGSLRDPNAPASEYSEDAEGTHDSG
jgi:hypothetical protein